MRRQGCSPPRPSPAVTQAHRRPEGKDGFARRPQFRREKETHDVRRSPVIRTLALSTAALALGLSAAAHAGHEKARIVSRHDAHAGHHDAARIHKAGGHHAAREHYLNDSGMRVAAVVTRPIAHPNLIVSRGMSEQPVHKHLVEVRIGVTTIFLDPHKEYRRQNTNAIDENHTIIRALGLADSMRSHRAKIVRRHHHHHAHHTMAAGPATIPAGKAPVKEPGKSAPEKSGEGVGILAKAE